MKIGIDILDKERIAELSREKLAKIFTEAEMSYLQANNWEAQTIAGMFCAKEAFFKAVGTGLIPSKLHEVEIRYTMLGAPYFKLAPRMINEHKLNTAKMHVSISHSRDLAIAVCVILTFDSLL